MSPRFLLKTLLMGAVFGMAALGVRGAGYGFDVLEAPARYAGELEEIKLSGANGTWMRVRGVVEPGQPATGDRTVETDRQGLARLRELGIKTVVFLRWGPSDWKNGVRTGGGQRMPLDLREAYARGQRLGAAYGDLVDAWEIENEPDIGFVAENPEVMAAFFKACSLGLKAGAKSLELRAGSCELGAKSCELGAESCELRAGSLQSSWRAQKRGWGDFSSFRSQVSSFSLAHSSPLVLMPPLAQPPGPYFEQLWANGLASYTDGFNYHFYGYSEDFTGVYRQFEAAVAELTATSLELGAKTSESSELIAGSSHLGQRKPLPVFLTEYGYGLMGGVARNTVEGRVRQWRWFADAANQIRRLRPEGPMAFVLNPYYEGEYNEFGLLMERRPSLELASTRALEPRAKSLELRAESSKFTADRLPLVFTPADFGARSIQPWMKRIGAPEGNAYASPALAYLQDYAVRHPYKSRPWTVKASPPSPVVIDFIAGDDMRQHKDYNGYWLEGAGSLELASTRALELRARSLELASTRALEPRAGSLELASTRALELRARSLELRAESQELLADSSQLTAPNRTGHGRVVLYNFSDHAMTGSLGVSSGMVAGLESGRVVTLAPGERRELPVELAVPGEVFSGHELRLIFTPAKKTEPSSVYQTMLYPSGDHMKRSRLADFDFPGSKAEAARALLLARPLAREEPPLHPDGRWLVSDGVKVTEAGGVWRFEVTRLPVQPLRPAIVELPLPADFVFEPDTMLWFKYRKVVAPEDGGRRLETGDLRPERTEDGGRRLETGDLRPEGTEAGGRRTEVSLFTYVRTANGNLYIVTPRLRFDEAWMTCGQYAQNFTMGFFGRAALPWRFADNRPVSLVFFLSPTQLPFTIEFKQAQIVRFARSSH